MAIAGLYKIFDHWHATGTVWLYSDPHFGDEELAAGTPGRPTDEEQIKMINAKVGRKDTLIILGDVGDVECARQLRGRKILIMPCNNFARDFRRAFLFHVLAHTVIGKAFRVYALNGLTCRTHDDECKIRHHTDIVNRTLDGYDLVFILLEISKRYYARFRFACHKHGFTSFS